MISFSGHSPSFYRWEPAKFVCDWPVVCRHRPRKRRWHSHFLSSLFPTKSSAHWDDSCWDAVGPPKGEAPLLSASCFFDSSQHPSCWMNEWMNGGWISLLIAMLAGGETSIWVVPKSLRRRNQQRNPRIRSACYGQKERSLPGLPLHSLNSLSFFLCLLSLPLSLLFI